MYTFKRITLYLCIAVLFHLFSVIIEENIFDFFFDPTFNRIIIYAYIVPYIMYF